MKHRAAGADTGTDTGAADQPQIRRIRHDTRRRELRVEEVARLSPHMLRITLGGTDLDGFVSAAPDDHIKVFLPQPDGSEERRDYTPRRFDGRSLVLDFVDHDGGPAAEWARQAAAGDSLAIGGPRGSQVIEGAIAHWLLIGDETALPAIGRRIEEMPDGARVTALIAVPGRGDEQRFRTAAKLDLRWIHRPLAAADDPAPLLAALRAMELPARSFAWIAAEAQVARALRAELLARGHAKGWLKASGYWVKGEADASVKSMEDDG